MTTPLSKLGLIAGGGDLPLRLYHRCQDLGREVTVIRLAGFVTQSLENLPGVTLSIGCVGRIIKTLKQEGCKALCFAGYVTRPDFTSLTPDFEGLKHLPGVIAAARHGDDALMRYVLSIFEKEGFVLEGADDIDHNLLMPQGYLGRIEALVRHQADINRAIDVSKIIGSEDIGQSVVVVNGLVLAVEAQEGTDAMLRRCLELSPSLLGSAMTKCGVLAKCAKPIQSLKIDLPTIGLQTIQLAAHLGLAGIVCETGRSLVLNRENLVKAADESGLFLLGVTSKTSKQPPDQTFGEPTGMA